MTSIGEWAFRDCSSLTSITLPEGVTSIGNSAFSGCSSLTAINIPEGVTSIGGGAFSGCSSLTAITIPASVANIERYAFSGCSALATVNIPENSKLLKLGERIFESCGSLNAIYIPAGVKNIGSHAFSGCNSLSEVHASSIEAWCNILFGGYYSNPLYYSRKLYINGEHVTDLTVPISVAALKQYAFDGCSSLTSVTLPVSLTSIGNGAFSGCSGITNMYCYADNVPSVEGNPFDNSLLESATLSVPENVLANYQSTAPWSSFATIMGLALVPEQEFSNEKVYTLRSNRAFLLYSEVEGINHTLCTNTGVRVGTVKYSLTEPNLQFSIKQHGGNYYLYSIGAGKYVGASGAYEETPNTVLSMQYVGGDYPWKLVLGGKGMNSQVPNQTNTGIMINDWLKTDAGNCYQITEAKKILTSGTCGDNLTWKLTEEYELVIEGTGDMYDYSPETTPWYEYRESMEAITIKEGITSIGDCAFHSCSKLKRIDIPEGVVAIGEMAMCLCNSVALITLPASLTEIDATAFNLSGNIIQFVVDEGNPIYADGINNAIVEKSTKTLIAGTVYGGVPDDIEHIGDYAFCGRNVEGAFLVPEGVVSIGRCAFLSSSISSIRIPKTLKICGDYAFQALSMGNLLSEISEVYIDDLVAWLDIEFMCEGSNPLCNGASLYLDNNLLESIVIPEDITNVKRFAFDGWNGENVVLPKSVISVGYLAFNNCSNLTSITCEATTPPAINCYAFYEVDKSIPVYVPSNSVEVYKSAEHWSEFTNYQPLSSDIASGTCGDNLTWKLTEEYELIIEGTGDMYDYSLETTPWYEYRESIQAITLPEGVTSIGEYAFSDCSSLTSITIPENVASIGYSAFNGCSSLSSVIIPESVTSIGKLAFAWCSNLITITVADGNTVYDSRGGCNAIIETSSNTLITGCSTTIIPESVTGIGYGAFNGHSGLLAITIPEGVTSFGLGAFSYCNSLTNLTIPESVTSIGEQAFEGCSSLTAIAIPEGVTSIRYRSFHGCSNLIEITLPENVTSIGAQAFEGCSSLTAINIPEGVTSIGYYAFYDCSSLTAITIPEGVTSIGSYAFYNTAWYNNQPDGVIYIGKVLYNYKGTMPENTTIEVKEGTVSISPSAFYNCSSLTSITIPESVTSIEYNAFDGCYALTAITCHAVTPPTIYSSTFGNVNKSIPVYVPAASVGAYQSAAYWSEFTNILPIEEPTPDYVTITISKYGSGTYSSAYALDFSEVQGLKAYVATGYNYHTGVVTLLRVHTADAATGLLVKGTPGASYEVPVMEYTADRTLNMMVATLERTEVDSRSSDGVYANYKYTVDPAQNPDEPLFYPFVDNSHLSAGKAYLQIPVAWLPDTGQKSIRYRFDEGETTDIEDEEIRNQKSEIIYDLYGRRVLSPKKGEIYIINNQKVVY